jgi:hypothetical protein
VLLALIAIRQPAVGTWLANLLLSRFAPLPRASAHVASVRGDWIGWLELHDLRVVRGDTLLAAVDTLRARYRLGALVLGRLEVRELALSRVLVTADARDTTRRVSKPPPLTFEQVLQGRFYTGLPIHVGRLSLGEGTIGGRAGERDTAFRITRLALRARDLQLGRGLAFRVDSLAGVLHPGAGRGDSAAFDVAASLAGGRAELGRLRFLGAASDVEGQGALAIGTRDTLQSAGLTLRARPLSLADLAGFVPGRAARGRAERGHPPRRHACRPAFGHDARDRGPRAHRRACAGRVPARRHDGGRSHAGGSDRAGRGCDDHASGLGYAAGRGAGVRTRAARRPAAGAARRHPVVGIACRASRREAPNQR